MSRKTNKGFKRLNTHEMIELNGQGPKGDSGSEDDILDFTSADEPEPRGNCSCCMWFAVLYMGVLTVMVLLVASFTGYILVSTWQMSEINNSTAIALQDNINRFKADFKRHREDTYHVLDGIRESMFELNSTFSSHNLSVKATLEKLVKEVGDLADRLKVIETHPREVLIDQIEAIHKEMAVLDMNMDTLNQSLDELHDMRGQMASMGSTLSNYDTKLQDLTNTISDTVHDNTELQDSVQGASDRILDYSNRLDNMQKSLNQSSIRFAQLQSQVMKMNDTMKEEMGGMWTNLTITNEVVETLRVEVNSLAANLTTISNRIDRPSEEESTVAPSSIPVKTTPTPPQPSLTTEPEPTSPVTTAKPTTPSTSDEGGVSTTEVASLDGELENAMANTSTSHDELTTAATTTMDGGDTSTTMGGGDMSTTLGGGDMSTAAGGTMRLSDSEEKPRDNSAAIEMLRTLYNNFDTADIDENGYLNMSEFIVSFSTMPKDTAMNVFYMLDVDQGGSISKSEIVNILGMLQAKSNSGGNSPILEGNGGAEQ